MVNLHEIIARLLIEWNWGRKIRIQCEKIGRPVDDWKHTNLGWKHKEKNPGGGQIREEKFGQGELR